MHKQLAYPPPVNKEELLARISVHMDTTLTPEQIARSLRDAGLSLHDLNCVWDLLVSDDRLQIIASALLRTT